MKVIDPNDKNEKLLAKGLLALQTGDFESALIEFKALPDNTAKNALLKNYHLGLCHSNLNQLDKALKYYKKIREIPNDEGVLIDKTLYSFYVNTGSVLQVLGRRKKRTDFLKEAIECYTYATQIKEGDAAVWNNLGNCYLDIEDYESAHEKFDEAIKLNNMFPQAHYSKSVAYKMSKNYPDAVNQLKIAYSINVGLKSEEHKMSKYYKKELEKLNDLIE